MLIWGAGAAPTVPASICVATVNGTPGSTAITYSVVTLDSFMGYAAAATCSTSTAASALNAKNNVSLAVTIGAAANFAGYVSNGTSGVSGNLLTVIAYNGGYLAEGQSIVGAGITTTGGMAPDVLYQQSGVPGQAAST